VLTNPFFIAQLLACIYVSFLAIYLIWSFRKSLWVTARQKRSSRRGWRRGRGRREIKPDTFWTFSRLHALSAFVVFATATVALVVYLIIWLIFFGVPSPRNSCSGATFPGQASFQFQTTKARSLSLSPSLCVCVFGRSTNCFEMLLHRWRSSYLQFHIVAIALHSILFLIVVAPASPPLFHPLTHTPTQTGAQCDNAYSR